MRWLKNLWRKYYAKLFIRTIAFARLNKTHIVRIDFLTRKITFEVIKATTNLIPKGWDANYVIVDEINEPKKFIIGTTPKSNSTFWDYFQEETHRQKKRRGKL